MGQLINSTANGGWIYDSATHDVLNVQENWTDTNGNFSNVTIWISVYHTGGASESGTFNGQIWVNGGLVCNNTWGSGTIGAGEVTIASWSGNIGHDGNGNAAPYIQYYVNQPVTSMSTRGGNWGLAHINRIANINSLFLSAVTDTKMNLNWGADANCDYVSWWSSGIAGGAHHDIPVSGSGGFVITMDNLASGKSYDAAVAVRRADSGLWTNSGTISATTLRQDSFMGLL